MTHETRNDISDERLEAMLAELETEKAPASLTRRLNRIPEEHRSRGWKWPWQWSLAPAPRWAMAPALAALPLFVLAVFLLQDRGPSPSEVEQARHDLAVAFAYMDRVGLRTGAEIQGVLGSELRQTVKQPLVEHLLVNETSRKEETS